MRREEYLHTLTEQIRCKMARGTIEQEINDHIEDQKEEFLSEGMSQTEAEEAAVAKAEAEAQAAEAAAQSVASGQEVIDYACQFIGNPYVWGGTSLTDGADCSGFVQSVYAHFGISLPRTSYEQRSAGYEVSYEDAQPGDLIFYAKDGYVHHVVMYAGDGKTIEAANEDVWNHLRNCL